MNQNKLKYLIRFLSMLIIDSLLISLSLFLSLMIRWDGQVPAHMLAASLKSLLVIIPVRLFTFYINKLYTWTFRYASLNEALKVFKAVSLSSLFLVGVMVFADYRRFIGRTVPVIDFLLLLFFVLAFRFFYRFLIQLSFARTGKGKKRVLIIGAGRSGEGVARELVNSDSSYYPVGFVDDDHRKKGQNLHGVRVLGKTDQVSKIVKKYSIEEILIAMPSAPGKTLRRIISSCENLDVRFKILPGLTSILSGKAELKKARNVTPEDLLGRESVRIDDTLISSYIQNKVVLVTGSGGSIGSELVRQITRFSPKTILMIDICENDLYFLDRELAADNEQINYYPLVGDIKDVAFVKYIFSSFKPQIVFHAAAHKHVPLMEDNPAEAVKNNVFGSRNIIYAASHYNAERFVLISTDKAVNPTNVMGATKRLCEMLCQAKSRKSRTRFMAVRFGNVIGSNGSVVPLFKKQIEAGKDITVTHPEIRRFFMTVGEAVQLVLQAGAMGEGGEIFILDMGEQVKIVDLAKNLITLSGLEIDRDISISYTGLRPGEKLYEEVLHDTENDQTTTHDRIFIAPPDDFDLNNLNKDISRVWQLCQKMDHQRIIDELKKLVTTFKHAPNR